MPRIVPAVLGTAMLIGAAVGTQGAETLAPCDVPARSIPVPDAVSPQIQALPAAASVPTSSRR